MKKYLNVLRSVVLGASLFVSSLGAYADSAPASPDSLGVGVSLKIGVLDKKKLAEESKVSQNVRVQLQKMADDYQKSFSQEEKGLRTAQEALMKKQPTLSPDAFKKEQEKFQQKVEAFQKKVEASRLKLEQVSQKADQAFEVKMVEILKSFHKKGIHIILWLQAVASADETVVQDITSDVIEVLDKEMPSVDLGLGEKKKAG